MKKPVLLLLFCFSLSLLAAPSKVTISTAYPKWIGNMRVAQESYCQLEVRFVNKEKDQQSIELEVFDTRYPLSTWNYQLTLAGRSYSTRRFPLKLDSGTKQLKLRLYKHDGTKRGELLSETNTAIRKSFSKSIAVLSDSLESATLGVTELKKEGWNVAKMTVLPSHWSELRKLNVLILHKLDKKSMNKEVLNYLRTYVENGGTLLFNHISAIEFIYDLGGHDIIPVNALGMKKLYKFKLDKDRDFIESSLGLDFIDSRAVANTKVLLKDNGSPMFASRRVGLGQSLFFALPMEQAELQSNYSFNNFYNYLLKYSGGFFLPSELENGASEEVSSEMNGIEVPGTSVIFWFSIIYSILIAGVFISGSVMKKKVASWKFAVTASVVTLGVLMAMRAKVMNIERENISASFSYKSMVSNSISEELISTYFTKSGPMKYERDAAQTRMGNVTAIRHAPKNPPEINPETGEGVDQSKVEGMLSTNFLSFVNNVDDIKTGGLSLSAGQSRSLVISNPITLGETKTMTGVLGATGLKMKQVQHDWALLVGINGAQEIKGDFSERESIKKVFEGKGRLIPYYVSLHDKNEDAMELQAYPLNLVLESGPVFIPANLTSVDFVNTHTIMKDPYSWQNQILPQMSYKFSLRVPPSLAEVKAAELKFYIDVVEQVPEIELSCGIEGLEAVKVVNGVATLKLPKKLQNQSLAELKFRLRSSRKASQKMAPGQINGSRWKISSFKLEVKGNVL